MTIAQPAVAGEGNIRPEDAPALPSALTADGTKMPWATHHAEHRAMTVQGIPARARQLLAALARTVNAADPYAAIFARRELLAARGMQSERTLYRALDDLEAAGLIRRAAQRRYVETGVFGRALVYLTELAALTLGLVSAPEPAQVDQLLAVEEPTQAGPTDKVADGAYTKDLSPFVIQKRQQPGQLPADLQRLGQLGFQKFLIFKLMRQAREHGKRLSDVVEATWTDLQKAHRPICYLRALLAKPVDFSRQVHLRREQFAEEAGRQRQAAETARTMADAAGRTFCDDTGTQYEVEPDGMSVVVRATDAVARRLVGQSLVGFAAAVRRGTLKVEEGRAQSPRPASLAAPAPRLLTDAARQAIAGARAALRAGRKAAPAMA